MTDVLHVDQRNLDYQNWKMMKMTIISFCGAKIVKKFGRLELLALVKKLALG